MKWYFVAVLLTVLTSSQGILTTLSQTKGRYLYDYATVPFLAELYKLVVSASLLWRESRISQPTRITTEWKTVRLYPIPSIIYLIHNNVQFATLTYVDTSTYQIMGNLKIVTTGILFRLFLKRKLSNLQWMAIVLLAVGTTTSQVRLTSLFGVIFNMAKLIVDDFQSGFEKGPWWQRLFNGYSITTWLVVLNLGSTGLLVSWLMKYADNIVKVYSTSMAMLLTMVLSVFLFSFKPTLQLFLGIVICMMSLHMYFAPPNKLVDLPAPIKPAPEALKEVSIDRSTES
ncbi:CMP-sialic acid transporter 1 [Linum grandiflorum]